MSGALRVASTRVPATLQNLRLSILAVAGRGQGGRHGGPGQTSVSSQRWTRLHGCRTGLLSPDLRVRCRQAPECVSWLPPS